MPKIDRSKIAYANNPSYPKEFAPVIAGREKQRLGDAAGWRANGGVGHCLINRTGSDALYLEVGTRSNAERVHYPDVDFCMERDDKPPLDAQERRPDQGMMRGRGRWRS